MAEMSGAPTLSWNLPNLITVTLMVLITFAVVGFAIRAARAVMAGKSENADSAPEAA